MATNERKITYKNNPALYKRSHRWVYQNFGKATCCFFDSKHKARRFEWANISGRYLEIKNDWLQLCPSCHRKLDYTEEWKNKISFSHKGRPAKNRKLVIQLTKRDEFIKKYPSVTQAAIETGILRTSIDNSLNGLSKTAGNYKWKYQMGVNQ